jgi:hypothetical protein
MHRAARRMIGLFLVATAGACASDATLPHNDPLLGMEAGEGIDVSDQLSPPAGSSTGFAFHGYVIGQPAVGTSPAPGDSLASWPRVGSAAVRVYRLAGVDAELHPIAGEEVGAVTSGADGYFQFSGPLVDGEYVIAVSPPEGTPYRGFYWSYSIRAEHAQRLLGVVLTRTGS